MTKYKKAPPGLRSCQHSEGLRLECYEDLWCFLAQEQDDIKHLQARKALCRG